MIIIPRDKALKLTNKKRKGEKSNCIPLMTFSLINKNNQEPLGIP